MRVLPRLKTRWLTGATLGVPPSPLYLTCATLALAATIAGCGYSPAPTRDVSPSRTSIPTSVTVSTPSPTMPMSAIPYTTVMSSSVGGVYGIREPYAASTAPALFMIGDYMQLRQLWPLVFASEWHGQEIPPQHPLHQVDFNESLVLAFFLGPQPHIGYRIEVSTLRKSGSEVEMVVAIATPSPPLYPTLSSPCVFIAVKKTDFPNQGHITVKEVNGTIYVAKPLSQ